MSLSLPQAMTNFYPSCRQLSDSRDKVFAKPKDIEDLTSCVSHILNSEVKPIPMTAEAISNLKKSPCLRNKHRVRKLSTSVTPANVKWSWTAGWADRSTQKHARDFGSNVSLAQALFNPLPLSLRAALMAPALLHSNYSTGGQRTKNLSQIASDRVVDSSEKTERIIKCNGPYNCAMLC